MSGNSSDSCTRFDALRVGATLAVALNGKGSVWYTITEKMLAWLIMIIVVRAGILSQFAHRIENAHCRE